MTDIYTARRQTIDLLIAARNHALDLISAEQDAFRANLPGLDTIDHEKDINRYFRRLFETDEFAYRPSDYARQLDDLAKSIQPAIDAVATARDASLRLMQFSDEAYCP